MNKNTKVKFDFVSKSPVFSVVSILLVVGSLGLVLTKGLNFGIDFAGGTEIQVRFANSIEQNQLRELGDKAGLSNFGVQSFGEDNEYLVRFQGRNGATEKETNQFLREDIEKAQSQIKSEFAQAEPEIRRVDSVGPQVGDELKRNGLLAVFYSLLVILIYVGLRFDYKYAPGAVICLFHDAIVTLGIFSLVDKEVNVQILAAVLTLIGYSLNDTIVMYDRIRETEGILKREDMKVIVNKAINDMLSRTIITSLTTFAAVLSIFILGKGVIVDLAFALGIGIFIGTYSSIYVASPLVLMFDRIAKAQQAKVAATAS